MSQRRLIVVTLALMLGLFLSSLEVTVVSTAMPTIVAQLGGLEIYSWVFSIYMLTSTTTVPVFGRLSDMFGRKPIYLIGVFMFMLGSALSGQAQTMTQLVLFRALQGLGAGAVLPMAFTIIGDIYTLEQRARMQGLFSGVWGFSSIIGPVLGGFLVDQWSWRWVFYLNVPFGLLSAALIAFALKEPVEERDRGAVDFLGVALLTTGVLTLLYALLQGGTAYAWSDWRILGLFAVALVTLATFVWVELRVENPLLPMSLFGDRLFATASAHGFVAGFALFGISSYVPLFVQGVLDQSATRAGAALTPQILGWTCGSVLAGLLLLRIGPRRIAIAAMTIMSAGAALLLLLNENSPEWYIWLSMLLMGFGMGTTLTSYTVAIQSRVARRRLGVATSSLQFVRQIGGTIGVSLMGAVLAGRLTAGLREIPGGAEIDAQTLLDNSSQVALPEALAESFHHLLAASLQPAFFITFVAVVLGLIFAFLTPRGTTRQLVSSGERGESMAPSEIGSMHG